MTTLAEQIRAMPDDAREAWWASLTPAERLRVAHDWRTYARPTQLPPPGKWRWWIKLAGRGEGKTRGGSEHTHVVAEQNPGGMIAIVGKTYADARNVMIEGESGVVATQKPWNPVTWEPGKKLLTWRNGAQARLYTADKPDSIAGANLCGAWGDEWCLWRLVNGVDALDQIALALRVGNNPHAWLTSTPRPTRRVRDFLNRPGVVVVRGSTMDNRDNLSDGVVDELLRRYEGTRLGRQELYAEVLDDVQGALWRLDDIDGARIDVDPDAKPDDLLADLSIKRVVVSLDVAVTSHDESDESGIVVIGISQTGDLYVLDDQSGRYAPREWASMCLTLLDKWDAEGIVYEANQGGDMIPHTIHAYRRAVRMIRVHASRGKATRAAPVAALYEQGHVHHVGRFLDLEDQLISWVPGNASPDRLDALVWGVTHLSPEVGRRIQTSARVDDALDILAARRAETIW